jgi:hypothetical protein
MPNQFKKMEKKKVKEECSMFEDKSVQVSD